ncbi:hypothetical protein [Promicromonospora soli]
MGVDVALFRIEQEGTSTRRRRFELLDVFLDKGDEFMRACADAHSPMLARVKPYGSLVLASGEMEQFVEELMSLVGSSRQGFLEPFLTSPSDARPIQRPNFISMVTESQLTTASGTCATTCRRNGDRGTARSVACEAATCSCGVSGPA